IAARAPAGAAAAGGRVGFLRGPDAVGNRHPSWRAAGDGEDAGPAGARATEDRDEARGEHPGMNHDEVVELAAAYALGALDGEERARLEALLHARDVDE